MNAARVGLFAVIALAVALAANLVLLGIANGPGDPVGRLNPRAGIVGLPAQVTPTAPASTAARPPSTPSRNGEGPHGSNADD